MSRECMGRWSWGKRELQRGGHIGCEWEERKEGRGVQRVGKYVWV